MLHFFYASVLEPTFWLAGKPEICASQQEAYFAQFAQKEADYSQKPEDLIAALEEKLEVAEKRRKITSGRLWEIKKVILDQEMIRQKLREHYCRTEHYFNVIKKRLEEGDEDPELPYKCACFKKVLDEQSQLIKEVGEQIESGAKEKVKQEEKIAKLNKTIEKQEKQLKLLQETGSADRKKTELLETENQKLRDCIEELRQEKSKEPEELEIRKLKAQLQSERDKNKKQQTDLEKLKKEKAALESTIEEGKKKKHWLDQRERRIQSDTAVLIKEKADLKVERHRLQFERLEYEKAKRALEQQACTQQNFDFIDKEEHFEGIPNAYYTNTIGNFEQFAIRSVHSMEGALENIGNATHLCQQCNFIMLYVGEYKNRKPDALPLWVLASENWLLNCTRTKFILKNPRLCYPVRNPIDERFSKLKLSDNPIVGYFLMRHILFEQLKNVEELMIPATEQLNPLWFSFSKLKWEKDGEYIKTTRQEIAQYFQLAETVQEAIASRSGDFSFYPLEKINGYSLAYMKDGQPIDVFILKKCKTKDDAPNLECVIEDDVLKLNDVEIVPVIEIENAYELLPFLFNKILMLLETVKTVKINEQDLQKKYWKFLKTKPWVKKGMDRILPKEGLL